MGKKFQSAEDKDTQTGLAHGINVRKRIVILMRCVDLNEMAISHADGFPVDVQMGRLTGSSKMARWSL